MLPLVIALTLAAAPPDDRLRLRELTKAEQEGALLRALPEGRGRPRVEMIEPPPERAQAVSVVEREEGRFEVIARRARAGVRSVETGPGEVTLASHAPEADEPADEIWCAGPISRKTFEEIQRAWRAALAAAQPPGGAPIDPAPYVFGLYEQGEQPRQATGAAVRGTKIGDLVGIAHALVFLACIAPEGRPAVEQMISENAQMLLGRFRASGDVGATGE